MRMSMRRFTRLTNAFSKKFENLQAAVALHFAQLQSGTVAQDFARYASDGGERDGSGMVARGVGGSNVAVRGTQWRVERRFHSILVIGKRGAAGPDLNHEAHNRIPVRVGHALGRADRICPQPSN
jgi:hypothetical protein